MTAAAIGSMEFNKNLSDAEVVAVAYGPDYSQKLGVGVPAITLVGRNKEPLGKAFEEFSNWAESTDADAIDLTLVFAKDGGYRLCITPEISALYKRALKYETVVNPMAFQMIWIKIIETTSQPLVELREMLSAGIVRPFLFGAACYTGILQGDKPPIPEFFEPIYHREELLKFEIRFVDEGSKDDLHWQRIALGVSDHERRSAAVDRTIPKSAVWYRRKEALKRLFPVTLWRSKSLEKSTEIRRISEIRGLREWQIDQAICNLVLSREMMNGNLFYQGCTKPTWPDQLWNVLCNRFEISDMDQSDFKWLTVENIVRQAILDARMLLKQYGVKRVPYNLERIQYLLHKHSLLVQPENDLPYV